MRDIDYFTKDKMQNKGTFNFNKHLPYRLEKIFRHALRDRNLIDDSTSEMKHYDRSESNGLTAIRIKTGMDNNVAWIPITGWIAIAASAALEDYCHPVYFDTNTGECLGTDKNKAASRLNDIGNDHYQAVRYEQALEYYQHAYLNNSGNSHNDAVYKANRANTLIQLGRYEDSIAEADRALGLDSGYDRAKNTKARAYSAWASKLWDEKKYTESAAKYKLAYETCTSGYEYEQLYRNNWHNSQAEAYNQEGHRLKGLNNGE